MNLRDFLPPIILEQLTKIKHGGDNIFNSYQSASALCKNGYQEDSLVRVVYEKTKRFRDILEAKKTLVSDIVPLRSFFVIRLANLGKELNVLDFGGACGAHYFFTKSLLNNRVDLRWHVIETPKMVDIASRLDDGKLKFYDDIEKAKSEIGKVDIVYSSGGLQYVSQPYLSLQKLTQCGASDIFITRVGLSTLPKELITIQTSYLSSNGPGPMPEGIKDAIIRYPVTFARKDKFEEIISTNYKIRVQFNEDRNAYSIGKYFIHMYGYFGTLKTTANRVA